MQAVWDQFGLVGSDASAFEVKPTNEVMLRKGVLFDPTTGGAELLVDPNSISLRDVVIYNMKLKLKSLNLPHWSTACNRSRASRHQLWFPVISPVIQRGIPFPRVIFPGWANPRSEFGHLEVAFLRSSANRELGPDLGLFVDDTLNWGRGRACAVDGDAKFFLMLGLGPL